MFLYYFLNYLFNYLSINFFCKSKDEEEQTALHYAITCEFDSIIELLVKNGADKTIANAEGETPIDIASKEIITKYLS